MNHEFSVDRDSLPDAVEETHVSLFDGSNAGIAVEVVSGSATEVAAVVRARAAEAGAAVWLAAEDGDPQIVRQIGDLAARDGNADMELIYGSTDVPGARLLDATLRNDPRATHVFWTTGGSFVPAEEYEKFYRRGCESLARA